MYCQACKQYDVQVELKDDVTYHLCHNCLINLVMRNLSKEQYHNLVAIHGSCTYLLHEDFYDDDGTALQPVE